MLFFIGQKHLFSIITLQAEAPLMTIQFHLRAVLTWGRWCEARGGGAGWCRVQGGLDTQLYFNTSQPGRGRGPYHGIRFTAPCYVCPEIFKHEVVHCRVFQAYELFYISKNMSCVRS